MSRDEVQGHINTLWRLNQGTLLYLSAGAGRGLELTEIHGFSEFQEFFNCLRFSMKSNKNVLHGVDKNRMIDHFIPPSLARYIIVLNLCLYPVVTTNGFTLPKQSDADTEANLMFQEVMKLAKPLGCKENRDMIAQMMNYMSPKAVATFSTSNEFATQLHHSPGVHEASYSSTVYERDSNGNFKLHSCRHIPMYRHNVVVVGAHFRRWNGFEAWQQFIMSTTESGGGVEFRLSCCFL